MRPRIGISRRTGRRWPNARHRRPSSTSAPDSAAPGCTGSAGFAGKVIGYGLLTTVVNRDWVWRRFLRWAGGEDVLDRADIRLVLAGIREYKAKPPPQTQPAEDQLRSVGLPVLALFGGRSVVHDSAAAAARARALLPHAEVEVLPDAGHFLHLRPADRDRIVERLLAFVRSA